MATGDVLPSFFDRLDPDFQKEVELMKSVGNWADLCVAPPGELVFHPHDHIDNHAMTGRTGGGFDQRTENRPDDLPMHGLQVDDFFREARLLSGWNFPTVDRVYNVLMHDWDHMAHGLDGRNPSPENGHYLEGLAAVGSSLFGGAWSGTAASACAEYLGSVLAFVREEMSFAHELANQVLAYSSLILEARKNLMTVMRDFVNAMSKKEGADVAEESKFGVTVLNALVGIAMGFAVPEVKLLNAPSILVPQIGGVMGQAEQNKIDHSVNGSEYSAIASDYLTKAAQVTLQVFDQINQVIVPKMQDLVARIPTPLPAPQLHPNSAHPTAFDQKAFDADHETLHPEALEK